MALLEAFTRSARTTLADAREAQQFSTTWADLLDPLQGGQIYIEPAIADPVRNAIAGKSYTWRVPQALNGLAKGIAWDKAEQDRMELVGEAPVVTAPTTDTVYDPGTNSEAPLAHNAIAGQFNALIGGAPEDADTLAELNRKIVALQPPNGGEGSTPSFPAQPIATTQEGTTLNNVALNNEGRVQIVTTGDATWWIQFRVNRVWQPIVETNVAGSPTPFGTTFAVANADGFRVWDPGGVSPLVDLNAATLVYEWAEAEQVEQIVIGDLNNPGPNEAASTQDVADAIAAIPADTTLTIGAIATPATDEVASTQDIADSLPTVDQEFVEESDSENAISHAQIAFELSQIRSVKITEYDTLSGASARVGSDNFAVGGSFYVPSGVQRTLVSFKMWFKMHTRGDVIAEVWRDVANINDEANRLGQSEVIVNAPEWAKRHDFTFTQPVEIPNDAERVLIIAKRVDGANIRYGLVLSYTTRGSIYVTVNQARVVTRQWRYASSPLAQVTFRAVSLRQPIRELPAPGGEGETLVVENGEWTVKPSPDVDPPRLLSPKFLLAAADPGADILADRTWVDLAADGLPAALHNETLEIHSDVAAGSSFDTLTIQPGDVFRAVRDTGAGLPENWIQIVAGDAESWTIVGASDGVIRPESYRLRNELITLPDSTSVPPPLDGQIWEFLPEDAEIVWNEAMGLQFQTEGGAAGDTALPDANSLDGSTGGILQVRYDAAGDMYIFAVTDILD